MENTESDRLSDLLSEFEKIDHSPDYKIEPVSSSSSLSFMSNDIWNKKTLKNTGIYASVFLIWSFVIVGIFLPSYVYIEEKFSFQRFLILSLVIFMSLIILYFGTKWVIKKFVK